LLLGREGAELASRMVPYDRCVSVAFGLRGLERLAGFAQPLVARLLCLFGALGSFDCRLGLARVGDAELGQERLPGLLFGSGEPRG
jgi:hypothetical protein